MQRRVTVHRAVQHVQLVGELVDYHVDAVLFAAAYRIRAGQHHRPALPGFTHHRVAHDMHHTVLVHEFMLRHELTGVDDHRHPARIIIQPEIEDRQAGLGSDPDARVVVQCKPAGRNHLLLI